jgi:hypothetical protein
MQGEVHAPGTVVEWGTRRPRAGRGETCLVVGDVDLFDHLDWNDGVTQEENDRRMMKVRNARVME